MDRELDSFKLFDPEIYEALKGELERQRAKINLIASENYASPEILRITGCLLTNKYAEGYPGKRYYSGCEFVDEVEELARIRAMSLFGSEHANVQPHSGTQANMAVYFSMLKPGDTIMTMDLSSGGHLSHGAKSNFSGMLYKVVHYSVNRETEKLDYDEVRVIAETEKPKLIVAGGSSYSRWIDFEEFREIADEVGAVLMVDMAHFSGLVAGKAHPSPVPYADVVTSTTHKTLRGPRGGFILSQQRYAERIDASVFPGTQGGPLMNVIAAKAVCFKEASKPKFRSYAEEVVLNARVLAEKLASNGLRVVSGGTDTHLFLIDLRPMRITGKEAQEILDSVDINVNMNEIPYDPAPPNITSGIRIGTPAITTRGMRPEHMDLLGDLITSALEKRHDSMALARVRSEIQEFARNFPLYQEVF